MPRVTSEFFVAALLRRAQGEGAFGVVLRKGQADAGAVNVVVRERDGALRLHTPALQASYGGDDGRLFSRDEDNTHDDESLALWLERQLRFDSDLWLVEIEDAQGRAFVDLAPE